MPGPVDRAAFPYPLPAVDAPLRVAFVGRRVALDGCVLHAPASGLAPTLVDVCEQDDPLEVPTALAAAAPHVVVAFAPCAVPAAVLAGLNAATLAISQDGTDVEAAAYDRVVVVGTPGARSASFWRRLPLPVDDGLYAEVDRSGRRPRALFLGASTERREHFLIQAKHRYDLLHYAHGLWGAELRDVMAQIDVGVNVRSGDDPGFEHRVLLHLAAGHLVLTEPLAPTYGLEPEIDFISIVRPDELLTALDQLERRPRLYERIRLSGHAKAQAHRASVVWPRLLVDLLDDVAAFGSERPTAPQRSVARGG